MNFQLIISNFQKRSGLGALVFLMLVILPIALADHGEIDKPTKGEYWAWNDIIGWIKFHPPYTNSTASDITVSGGELSGWADSGVGPIVFNCANLPGGANGCATSNFKVENLSGALRGWAWNDVLGWISFWCGNDHNTSQAGVQNVCGTTGNYGVTIEAAGNGQDSYFKGFAWSEVAGWISFSCENDNDGNGSPDSCPSNGGGGFEDWRVQTPLGSVAVSGGLESNVFDTGVADPQYNYILWRGATNGGAIDLWFASSDSSSGPWTDADFEKFISATVDRKKAISAVENGGRYYKYKLFLKSDLWQQYTSEIKDVVVNWSP